MKTMGTYDVLDGFQSLTPQIRTECLDLDKTRVVPDSIIDELRHLDTFRLLAPRAIGGAEVDPLTFLRVVEETSYADGSVGWCVMIGGCYSTFAGLLPVEGAREIYGDPETISAGAFRPAGVARRVEGGFHVSGRWQLGSGSTHANWFLGGCAFVDGVGAITGQSARPVFKELFFPSSEVTVTETWDSTGLRGTASHDYSVSNIFVPERRAFWFSDAPTADHPLYSMPVVGVFATYVGAVALGIGRHAIDAFTSLARAKTPGMSTTRLADKAGAQAVLGRAHALVTAGRISLVGTLAELWERVQGGYLPTLADHRSLWVAATLGAQAALDAVETLYAAGGASSVYATCPLDRCLRDARTAVQHIVLQEANYEHLGRELLVPDGPPGPWIMDYRGGA